MDKNTLNKIWKSVGDGLRLWTKYALLWLMLTFILRLGFFVVMLTAGLIKGSSLLTILSGVYFDIAVVLEVSSITIIPLLIINYFLPKVAKVLSIVFITLYVVIYGGLVGYYANVNLPLDRVFFVYGVDEMYNIVVSSVDFSVLPLLCVLVLIVLYSLLVRFWNRKINVSPVLSLVFLVVTILFVIIFDFKSLVTNDKRYKTYQDYCLAVNQMAYTANDFYNYSKLYKEDFSKYDEIVLEDAQKMHELFPNFTYVDIHYPFLRLNDDPDVLGCRFEPTTDGKAPDFVFIIVESLGQRLSSKRPEMSFTPFLDSLKQEGLYWPNCLALAERTFGAVPNIFSSAPYDKYGFARVWDPIPDHNSILKDMARNGYSLSFYYGGNASFDGQNTYMFANGVDYVMDPSEADFDQEQKELLQNDHSWGMYDMDMFNAAIKHREGTERNRPNTDMYITLSTHEPFYFKGVEEYQKKVEKMVANTKKFGPDEKDLVLANKEKYAAFLYADDCLRHIFNYYKSQPEFENTIFVIVGDHRMGRVYVNNSPLLKYNVPLVIYSPLLKEPKTFKGVVTHHDITPTFTAYLKNNYDYSVDDECHWLGTSLDTSSQFNCNQSVAFMLNNRDEIEYLHHGYMLCRDRVYEVQDSLNLDEIDDEQVEKMLKEYLRQYKNVDWYVTGNNFLIKKPAGLMRLYDYYKNGKVNVSISGKHGKPICDDIVLYEDYEKIYVDVKFDYKIKNGTKPQKVYIEFKINDGEWISVVYYAYRFSEISTSYDEDGHTLSAKSTFFVVDKDLVGLPLRISIYTEEDLEIEYHNTKIQVDGIPKKK